MVLMLIIALAIAIIILSYFLYELCEQEKIVDEMFDAAIRGDREDEARISELEIIIEKKDKNIKRLETIIDQQEEHIHALYKRLITNLDKQ
jgi:bacterioferritin (cytochrome b1)